MPGNLRYPLRSTQSRVPLEVNVAAALPLLVIMEKGAEAAEALNVTEIFYNRVADHIRNQPDAARSHAFDKQRMDELIQALDGWDDLDAQERSRRNKEIGNNRAYKMCKKFCVLDIAGELALVDLVHPPGNGPPVPPPFQMLSRFAASKIGSSQKTHSQGSACSDAQAGQEDAGEGA